MSDSEGINFSEHIALQEFGRWVFWKHAFRLRRNGVCGWRFPGPQNVLFGRDRVSVDATSANARGSGLESGGRAPKAGGEEARAGGIGTGKVCVGRDTTPANGVSYGTGGDGA